MTATDASADAGTQVPGPVTTSPARVKVPTMLQQAATECGAASLGMILAHYGRWVSLDQLRNDCGVDRDGASLQAVAEAANSVYGMDYEGHKGDAQMLDGLPVPAIIWWEHNHFVVLEGASKGKFHINDPARGEYALSREEFDSSFSGIAMTLSPTDAFQKQGHPYRATASLWERLRNSRTGVYFAIIAGVLAMLVGIVIAPLNQVFIDEVLGLGHESILRGLIVVLLAIGLIRAGLTLLQFGVLARLQAKFTLVGTSRTLDRLIRLPMMFYLERATGDLSQRMGYNATVSQLLAGQMASAGIALLATVGYAALLFYYNWIIALIVLFLISVNAFVLRMVQRRRTDAQNRILKRQNKLRGSTTSSIRDIETLKSTGRENDTFANLAGQQADYITASAVLVPSSALLAAVPPAIMALTTASILVIGGLFTIQGTFTLGALLAMQALAMNLNSPVQTLMSTGSQLQVITSSLQALDDILLNEEDERFERSELVPGEPIPSIAGHLVMDKVDFGYGDKAPLLLKHFDLEVKPGHRVALVGTSGAGKTTIGNLAAGLFMPRSGQVLYDGRTLDEFPQGVLEGAVVKVDQSVVLFEGTVRDNVTLWDPTIPTADVMAALEDAQILPDVLARQGGLDAVVEEDGRNFSGGQAQRIEIARALVRNPRFVILDEATSALDDITEKQVDAALRRRGVAALIIAHRLSTIRDSDEIIVLGRGGVVLERGTHEDLMAAEGEYARMVAEAGEGGDVGS